MRGTSSIALRDGRKVAVEEYGDPSGVPALWFHGAFSSRLEAWSLDEPAKELGVRVLSLDRPGLGGSDPLPGRTVVGYGDDVREVLDELGVDKAAVGGLSNGGMYAMAVASVLPDRVLRAVPYNPSSPVADEVARAALGPEVVGHYELLMSNLEHLDAMVAQSAGAEAIAATTDTNPDAHLLKDPVFAAAHEAVIAEARRQAGNGYLQVELTHSTSVWGFDHRAVSVPVTLVSGEQDAGLAYAKVWMDEVPNGRLVVVPGGHGGMAAPAVSRTIVQSLAGEAT